MMTKELENHDDDSGGGMIVVPVEVEEIELAKGDGNTDQQDAEIQAEPEETLIQRIYRAAIIMRDGNEIQRISIVRNLPSLMNDDPDECLIRLIPAVQDVLCGTGSGTAGLELHFEASQAYKDIIVVQHQRHQRSMASNDQENDTSMEKDNNGTCAPYTIDLGLCSQILKGIVQNIEAHDSIACTAWLDTLLEVVDHLPLCLIRSRVLPMAVQKAQQLNSVQARLTATKLFGRLTTKLEPNEIKSEVVPLVQALCQDSDASVRASVCQQLPLITRCLQLTELNSIVLPLVIEFSKDEDETVREANLETLATLIDTFDDETCGQVLVPLVKKFVDGALKTASGVRRRNNKESGQEEAENDDVGGHQRNCTYTTKSIAALAKNYGLLCHSLERYLTSKQKRWFLERFCDLASLGADDSSAEDTVNNNADSFERMSFTARKDSQAMLLACRRHAAYNFPAMVQMAAGAPDHLIKEMLLPQFKRLCQDSETDVRIRVAAGFHEFAKSLGDDAALLIDSFVDLVYSGDPEVIGALTGHLTETLECIYGAGRATSSATIDNNGNLVQHTPTSYTQLTRILLACNRLIRNGSNWRCHEQLMTAFACLSQFISNDELCQSFVPMMKEEVVNSRAVPCRVAALRTLVKWTRDLKRPADINGVVSYCVQILANNRSCHKRVLFLDACEMFVEYLSKQFFKENLLLTALQMVHDPVLNIRMKLCKLLPLFKCTLLPSVDSDYLTALENAVKILLNSDNQGYMGEMVKKVINELAHADAVDNVVTASSMSRSTISPPKDKQLLITKPPIKKKAEVAPMPVAASVPVENGKSDELENPVCANGKENAVMDVSDKAVEKIKPVGEDKEKRKLEEKEEETKQKRTARSPSPPNRRTSTTSTTVSERTPFNSSSTTATTKKTAIVQPRQVISRSPSPRPPLNQYTYQKDSPSKLPTSTTSTSSTKSSPYSASQNDTNGDSSAYKRPPRPSTTSSTTTSATSSYGTNGSSSRSSTISDTPSRTSLMKSASSSCVNIDRSSSNERIVPIRLVESSSSASLRPPTPITYRRTARERTSSPSSSYQSPLTRSSSTSNANSTSTSSSSALPPSSSRRTSTTSSRVRDIPVIRTGTVTKSIERYESPSSTSRRTDSDLTLPRRYTSTTSSDSSGLGYTRSMNRSFSSFGRDSGLSSTDTNNNSSGTSSSRYSSLDSRKDYLSSPSPLRRSTYSTSTLSSDRGPYSLTKVRSGSSLASASGYTRSSALR